jgi:hypothetical protein
MSKLYDRGTNRVNGVQNKGYFVEKAEDFTNMPWETWEEPEN